MGKLPLHTTGTCIPLGGYCHLLPLPILLQVTMDLEEALWKYCWPSVSTHVSPVPWWWVLIFNLTLFVPFWYSVQVYLYLKVNFRFPNKGFSLVPGAVPTLSQCLGRADDVVGPFERSSRGEGCRCSLSTAVHHFASLSVLLQPPPHPAPPPTHPCAMLLSRFMLLFLLLLRINHRRCIATSLVSYTPPSPPTKVPQL